MKYLYSVVRFVPDPINGETVNLGVIAGSDESSAWHLRRSEGLKRIRAFDTKRLLPQVLARLEELALVIDDYQSRINLDLPVSSEITEAWLHAQAHDSQNILQFSDPSPVVAESVEDAVDSLFEQFVVEVDTDASADRGPNKRSAVAATRRAYRSHGLEHGKHFIERASVLGPALRHEAFDLTVFNGRVLQLVQGFSFNATGEEQVLRQVRSWAWTVRGLRDAGGSTTVGTRNVEVPRDVDIEAVYVPPRTASSNVLAEAMGAFEELGVLAVPIESAEVVGETARRLVRAASA